MVLANSSGNNNGCLSCQTDFHVYPHIGATNTRLLRAAGDAKGTLQCTGTQVCCLSHAIDCGKPPQDDHLQFQDADVLSRLPEQSVHIGIRGVRDDLLQLPESLPHHALEWPPAYQRRRSFVLPHCEHGFPSHISAEAISVITNLWCVCVEEVCRMSRQGRRGLYI